MRRTFCLIITLILLSLSSIPASAQPLIGISSGFSKSAIKVKDTYTIAVSQAGGIPVVLPLVRSESEANALVRRMDGVIFSGGEDVNPSYYGEHTLFDNVDCNFLRDTSDMLILKAAIKQRKAILGICRGMQLVNVGMGGTLYQDIPLQVPSEINHKQTENAIKPTHNIRIEPGSILRTILGTDSVYVNSKHHQSVKDVAPGLKVTAKADDGIIEAVEGSNIVCVQFHPETLIKAGNEKWLPLFRNLVARSSSNK